MATSRPTGSATRARRGTLAVDVGGSGVKALVLADDGSAVSERERIEVEHPCPPDKLLGYVAELRQRLPATRRIGLGFPGLIRGGVVLTAPNYISPGGPGTAEDGKLRKAWLGFDLAGALTDRFRVPARVANDADVQGLAVVEGKGFELVLTLGTGLGTALFYEGELLPHLEISHHPFRKGENYDEQVGDRARRSLGDERWTRRVVKAVAALREVTHYDRLYIGGGNARRLTKAFTEDATIVDNVNGIRGALHLFDPKRVSRQER